MKSLAKFWREWLRANQVLQRFQFDAPWRSDCRQC